MALNAGVVCANVIELRRIHDVGFIGIAGVLTAWAMTPFTTDIPFGWRLRLYVVVDGMAAITQWSCWAPHVIGGVEREPPSPVLLYHIIAPQPVWNCPLGPGGVEHGVDAPLALLVLT